MRSFIGSFMVPGLGWSGSVHCERRYGNRKQDPLRQLYLQVRLSRCYLSPRRLLYDRGWPVRTKVRAATAIGLRSTTSRPAPPIFRARPASQLGPAS